MLPIYLTIRYSILFYIFSIFNVKFSLKMHQNHIYQSNNFEMDFQTFFCILSRFCKNLLNYLVVSVKPENISSTYTGEQCPVYEPWKRNISTYRPSPAAGRHVTVNSLWVSVIRINGINSILVFKADVISQNLWAIYIFLPFYGFWNEVEIYNKISHWTTLVASSWFPVSRLFSSFLQFMWYLCSIQVKNIGMTENVNLFGWQSWCTHQYK